MKVDTLTVDPKQAREIWRKYNEHRAFHAPHDAEIAAIYKRLAQGKTVIRALESIRHAGLNEQGLPKLAIARADEKLIHWRSRNNAGTFHFDRYGYGRSKSRVIDIPAMEGITGRIDGQAVVPIIPVHLRPKRALASYHILWEAEWSRTYPADPYLLRRFGDDTWLVVAAWDLTDVERAVMSSRIRS